MNLTESIYFDGELVYRDKPTRIIYRGILADTEPEAIYMHCGYGLLWENLHEIKLLKGVSGYEADVTFTDYGDAFFCFRSTENKWDNNFGQNYTISVEKQDMSLVLANESIFLPEVPRLKRGYLIKKKIKVAFYRTISTIAKLISGDFLKFWRKKKKT